MNAKLKKPRGKPFAKGVSGNPAGRPQGSRNRSTALRDLISDDQSEAILNTMIKAAMDGNLTAARYLLDRVAPASHSQSIMIDLPPIETVEAGAKAIDATLKAVGQGDITLNEAKEIIELIKDRIKLIETVGFEQRLLKVEQEIRDECLPLKFSMSA